MSDQQALEWMRIFGQQYTRRNPSTPQEVDVIYSGYGISRSELNEKFVGRINRSASVVEVGANVGNQLALLKEMGFNSLHGVDLQLFAIEVSNRRRDIEMVQGSALDIPFKDSAFDLVFTSGLLIHIHPLNIARVMNELHRCAREYIWGFEYYAKEYTEVQYRGQANMLWKTDFSKLFLNAFSDLDLVKEERLTYLDSDPIDAMFLLRKRS